MGDDDRGRGCTLAARPESARAARRQVQAWLDAARWPALSRDDIVYAVSEAVSNALAHAYRPGEITRTVEVRLRLEQGLDGSRRARVHINDHGRWRPPCRGVRAGGYGLVLIRRLMDEVVITPGEGARVGTEVMVLSPPVTAPHPPGDRRSGPPPPGY